MKFNEKIKAIIKILNKIIHYPDSLFLVLNDETEYKSYLNKKYGYNQLPVTSIENFFQSDNQVVEHYTFLDGTSMITDLALLRSLAQRNTACEYLEIGTWRGESIMNVAQIAKHCTSVNLSPEDIIKRGLPEKYARLHGCLIHNQSNITTIQADSVKFDFNSLNKKFDLIFIDGDHSYDGVKSDTSKVISLLKNDDAVIVWHDYGFNPESPRYSVLAAILDGLPAEFHKYLYHVSNTMCAILYKGNIISSDLTFPVNPEKVFNINFTVQKI